MKKMRMAAAAAAALALTFAGTSAAQADGHTGTIVDIAVSASGGGAPDSNPYDYDILVQAVLATGLAPVLADTGTDYTVFAPNDQAFIRLVGELTGTSPASEADALGVITTAFTIDQIRSVLLYHVVPGEALDRVGVLTAGSLTMADGGTVMPRGINVRDESPSLTDPRLVKGAVDIAASNGVIHTIDRVLVPAM